MRERAVTRRLVTLTRELRALGGGAGTGELLTAHRALTAVDAADRRDAYHALRAVLCSTHADLARFDVAWQRAFASDVAAPLDGQPDELLQLGRLVAPRVAVPGEPPRPPAPGEDDQEPTPVPSAYSAEELLRRKDFADYGDADGRAAQALLARLARRGPRRASRRTRPAGRRRSEHHDLRATARAALRHGGEPFERRWRETTTRPRPLVLVVDVSGSMAPYAQMLLAYAQACVAARRRVEAYALGTRLTRITRELSGRAPEPALERATRAVVDAGGGTRIGAALAELNREHGRRVGRGAVVCILSDGWDRGEPELLAAELARLRRCAQRVVWLCPLAADPRWEPLTQGLRAALPHTDHVLAGNSIASLEALANLMETIE